MVFIAENFHLQWADEVGSSNGQFHQRPVGAIDEIVVVDTLPAHHGCQLVVHTGNVGARVVKLGRGFSFKTAAVSQVAVANSGKGFSEFFVSRIKMVVSEVPTVGGNALIKPCLDFIHRDFAHIRNNQVRTVLYQCVAVDFPCDAQRKPEIPVFAGLYTRDGILDDHALVWLQSQIPGRDHEYVRIRLALQIQFTGHDAAYTSFKILLNITKL